MPIHLLRRRIVAEAQWLVRLCGRECVHARVPLWGKECYGSAVDGQHTELNSGVGQHLRAYLLGVAGVQLRYECRISQVKALTN